MSTSPLHNLYAAVASAPHPRIGAPGGSLERILHRVANRLYGAVLGETQFFVPEALADVQRQRLAGIIAKAKQQSSFYRERLRGITAENFSSLKPVARQELRNALAEQSIVAPDLEGWLIPRFTSGSTGEPFRFFLDRNMLARRLAVYRRLLAWAGWHRGDWVVRLIPAEQPGLQPEGTFMRCPDLRELEGMRHKIYRSAAGRPVLLHSLTSFVVRLAQLISLDRPLVRFRGIVSYGEALLPSVREYVESAFGAPVTDYYASNEMTAIGQECEAKRGFHVNSEWVYVEVVGPSGQPLPPGEAGEIVVTSFDNEVMPFIRYQIGDRGTWLVGPCGCGRTLPRIAVAGRAMGIFLRPDGSPGSAIAFANALHLPMYAIRQFQIKRQSRDSYTIRIVPLGKLSVADQESIAESASRYLGSGARVQVKLVAVIPLAPSGKQQMFINTYDDPAA